MIVFSVLMFCLGVIWPVEGMPPIMRFISNFTPLTHVVEAMRCVVSRGMSTVLLNRNSIGDGLICSLDIRLFQSMAWIRCFRCVELWFLCISGDSLCSSEIDVL